MDFKTEANIIRALGKIIGNGHLHKGAKPVHWCVDCRSALAEAEVEYYDKTSPSIDVAFHAVDKAARALFRRNSAAGRYALRCGASSAFRISGQPALLDTSGGGNHRAIYTGTRTDGNPGEISEHCALFNGVGVTVF